MKVMRFFILLLCLSITGTLNAGPIKGFKPLATKLTRPVNASFNSLYRQAASKLRTRAASMHNYISNHLLGHNVNPAVFLDIKGPQTLSLSQTAPVYQRYQQTLDTFEKFKKDTESFLYYQTIPSERHSLSSEEKRILIDRLIPLYTALSELRTKINNDPALEQAHQYTELMFDAVSPSLLQNLQTQATRQAEKKQMDAKKFCLYPTDQTPLPDPSVQLDGKNIVVINDNASILDSLGKFSHAGVLFPNAALHTDGDVPHFLLWMSSISFEPDIIFTDIQLGESTGYYIAYQLRKNGYKGGIIALTSYEEDEQNIAHFAARGFDGLISLQASSLNTIHIAQRLTQAAQIYLLQKEKK